MLPKLCLWNWIWNKTWKWKHQRERCSWGWAWANSHRSFSNVLHIQWVTIRDVTVNNTEDSLGRTSRPKYWRGLLHMLPCLHSSENSPIWFSTYTIYMPYSLTHTSILYRLSYFMKLLPIYVLQLHTKLQFSSDSPKLNYNTYAACSHDDSSTCLVVVVQTIVKIR